MHTREDNPLTMARVCGRRLGANTRDAEEHHFSAPFSRDSNAFCSDGETKGSLLDADFYRVRFIFYSLLSVCSNIHGRDGEGEEDEKGKI